MAPNQIDALEALLFLLASVTWIVTSYFYAERRGRRGLVWAFISLFSGFIALIVLKVIPDKSKPVATESGLKNKPRYRPSRWPYLFAALILGVAVSVFHYSSWPKDVQYAHPVDSRKFQHFMMPGTTTLELKRPGLYSFYEIEGKILEGEAVGPPPVDIPNHVCGLKSMPSGATINEIFPHAASSWAPLSETDGSVGSFYFEYQVTTPGTYEFSCHYDHSDNGPQIRMAVIDDYRNRTIDRNYPRKASLPIGFIISGGLFLWTYLKRKNVPEGSAMQSGIARSL